MSGPSVGRTQIVKAAPTTAPERATNCGGGGGGKGGVAGGDGGGGSGWRWQQRSWSFEEWVSRAVGACPAAHVVNGVITRSLALRKIERTTEREGERRMGTPEEKNWTMEMRCFSIKIIPK